MSALEIFESELRFKVDIKCPSGQMEESFLAKAFKFNDFHGKGKINFMQFFKALERIGVIATKKDIERVFYDLEQLGFVVDGMLDYKAYAHYVYNPTVDDEDDNK